MPGAVPAQQDGSRPADPSEPGESAGARTTPPAGHGAYAEHSGRPETEPEADSEREPELESGLEPEPEPELEPEPVYEPDPDDGPQPLGLHIEPTGHAPVDAQLRRLEDADHLAVSGHLEVYEDVHRGLRDTLTALDRPAPGPRAPEHPHPGS